MPTVGAGARRDHAQREGPAFAPVRRDAHGPHRRDALAGQELHREEVELLGNVLSMTGCTSAGTVKPFFVSQVLERVGVGRLELHGLVGTDDLGAS